MMQFSWKKSVFALFTGLVITGCTTSSRQDSKRPILMGARGGLVPQPYVEPHTPSPMDVQPPAVEPFVPVPVQPVAPLVVEPIEPVALVYKAPTPSTEKLEKYTVVKGDSLSRIAYRYKGFSYFELAKLNNLELNKPLKIGQVLLIPSKGVKKSHQSSSHKATRKSVAKKTVAVTPSRGKKPIPANGKYVVKSGDSLWLIGHRYGISTKELKRLNNLKSDNLHIGNVLVLKGDGKAPQVESVIKHTEKPAEAKVSDVQPLPPVSPAVPVVSAEQGGDAEVISIDSGLPSDSQELDVVVGRDGVPSTLKEIAEMYSVKEEDIKKANPGVDFSNLAIGQELKFVISE
jgi:LysM repeat protein